MRTFFSSASVLLLAPLFLLSAECETPEPVRVRFPVMGTEAILLLHADREQAERAVAGVKTAFERVLRIANPYDPESEVSRLNRSASREPFVCSGDLWTLLCAAREAWTISGGAFDITARPLMELWGFYGRGPRSVLPDEAERAEVLKHVGLDKVKFDDADHSVFFSVPGMALDLGGLAKGYAVDLALDVLRREGITRGMVNLGGNLGILEPPPGETGWPVRLLAPDRSLSPPLFLKNIAVSTSGDYERNILIAGERYGHIVDPRTGFPVRRPFSVTVLAPSALRADILSTVFFLEPETKLPQSEEWDGIRVIRNVVKKE